MKYSRGQLQIGVTMMVLLVFIVLLILSLILFFRFSEENIKESQQEILDERFSGLLDVIINMPELKYSLDGSEKNYLDLRKLENFDVVVANSKNRQSNYYTNVLAVDGIRLKLYDGDGTERVSKLIYGVERDLGVIYSSPVSVYDPVEEKFLIGILEIKVER